MNRAGYRKMCRRTSRDDIVTRQYFLDEEWDAYVQSGREQWAIRTLRLKYTPSVPFMVKLANGSTDYQLPRSIFRVTRVSLDGKALTPAMREDFENAGVYAESRVGEPWSFTVDEMNMLVLNQAPEDAADRELKVEGYYMPPPLEEDEEDDELIPLSDQPKVVWHALSQAYLIQDSEFNHIEKSEYFEQLFTKAFGKAVPFDTLQKHAQFETRQIPWGEF